MKRKVLAILMAAAMTMTVMAGCGGAAPSETKDAGGPAADRSRCGVR